IQVHGVGRVASVVGRPPGRSVPGLVALRPRTGNAAERMRLAGGTPRSPGFRETLDPMAFPRRTVDVAPLDTMSNYTVGYFASRLSRESFHRKRFRALMRLETERLRCTEIEYAGLPLYNRDYDAVYPPVARAFKDAVAAADAVLF